MTMTIGVDPAPLALFRVDAGSHGFINAGNDLYQLIDQARHFCGGTYEVRRSADGAIVATVHCSAASSRVVMAPVGPPRPLFVPVPFRDGCTVPGFPPRGFADPPRAPHGAQMANA